MVVSISHRGYIKRTPVSTYRAQRRGGKGIKGAKSEDEDPIEHVFAASTHDYLLFFTNQGHRALAESPPIAATQPRKSRSGDRQLVQLAEGENIAACRAIRDFYAPITTW